MEIYNYDKLIQKCDYKNINDGSSFENVKKDVLKEVENLDLKDLYDLRIRIYQEKNNYTIEKEKNSSLYIPLVMLLASTLTGYISSLCTSSLNNIIWGLVVVTLYSLFVFFVSAWGLGKSIKKNIENIESNNILLDIVNEEISKKEC